METNQLLNKFYFYISQKVCNNLSFLRSSFLQLRAQERGGTPVPHHFEPTDVSRRTGDL